MKLLILGATGPTGQNLVSQAFDAGHQVTVLVRNPRKLSEARPVTIIEGDPTHAATIAKSMRECDAVLSALGAGNSLKGDIASRSAAAIIPAMEQTAAKRLIVVSAFGVGESIGDASLIQKLFYRTLLRAIFADKAKSDGLIRESSLDWTIVRPVVLTNGPRTGTYRVAERVTMHSLPSVSRADVADFMLRELAERKWIRKTVVIR